MPTPPTLTAQQFAIVAETFDQVLDGSLSGEPALALIREQAAGDEVVAQSLTAMLEAHEAEVGGGDDDGFQASALEAVRAEVAAVDGAIDHALPKTIGPYEVVRFIASGGMGTVYEALQREPRRRVAIKVIRFELLSQQSVKRFEAEGHLLANLRHEGIAQVHAMGRTDTPSGSVPYLVLEYIDGMTITDYVREHALDVRARLVLLRKVCTAVQYAHDNGVLHRDLKPGNILVDGQGRPRVLDFGIARSFDDTAQQATLTASGMFMGTLAYMSPEQAIPSKKTLDVRVDVYGVGAVGYELLTGSPPHDISSLPIHRAVERIGRHDPRSLASHDPALGGDLSAIFGKALATDRDRRYVGVRAFDDDLRRYLEHEPVTARAPSALYQVGKLVRRNRLTFGMLALVLLSLVAGLTLALAQRYEAVDARADAQRTAREAERDRRAARLHAAWTALESGRTDEVSEFLEAEGPESRGLEFDLLRARAYGASDLRPVDATPGRLVVLSPDGRYAVTRGASGAGVRIDLLDGSSEPLFSDGRELPPRAYRFVQGRPDWLALPTRQGVTVVEVGTRRVIRTLDASSPRIPLDERSSALYVWRHSPSERVGTLFDVERGAILIDARLASLLQGAAGVDVHHGRYITLERPGPHIEVVDLETLTVRRAEDARIDSALAPRLTADGRFLIHTMAYPIVYDLEKGDRFAVGQGAQAVLVDLALSKDSRTMAVLGMDAGVRLWDLHERKLHYIASDARLAPASVPSQVNRRLQGAIGFHPDEASLRTVMSGKLGRWPLTRPATRFDHGVGGEPYPYVYALAWHPKGRWLASAAWEDHIVIWDTARGTQVGSLDLRETFRAASPQKQVPGILEPTSLMWSPDGESLATCTARGWVAVWSVWERRLLFAGYVGTRLLRLEDGGGLVLATLDGGTHQVALAAAPTLKSFVGDRLKRPDHPPMWAWDRAADPLARYAFGFATLGPRIAAGRHTHVGTVHEFRVWERGGEEPIWVGSILGDALAVELADEGRRLLVGTRSGTIHLYDVDQRRRLLVLRAHDDYIVALALAPDGSALASGSGDGWVNLDDLLPIGERMRRARHAEEQHRRLAPLVKDALASGPRPFKALHDDPRLAKDDHFAARVQLFSALK